VDDAQHVAQLVTRYHAGDAEAAALLFGRYAQRLARLAEQQFSPPLARRLDADDVVQSVFRTFFSRCARGEFRVDSSAQLWRLLVKITLCKVREKARFHHADKRNVHAESAPPDEAWLPEALGREPDPAEAVAMLDLIEAVLQGLPALYATILEMRLAGHKASEIASATKVSRQTVYRALELLETRVRRHLPGEPPPL
jgi:RNA polymerase sigma-70 factor (ECF subfamily)